MRIKFDFGDHVMSTTISRAGRQSISLRKVVEGYCNGNGTTDLVTTPLLWTDFITGTENPRHVQQIRDGRDATTAMQASLLHMEYVPGYLHTSTKINPTVCPPKKVGTNTWTGNLNQSSGSGTDPTSISITAADSQALMKLYASLRHSQTSFQGGVFLGELAETLHLLRHPAQTLRTGVDSYLKSVKRQVKRNPPRLSSRIVSDTWLEHSFGWQPLMHDIRDASLALHKLAHRRATKRVKVSFKTQSVVLASAGATAPATPFYGIERLITECIVIYSAGLKCHVVDPIVRPILEVGLTPSNFVPTVWELIPYSFLVDYFTNVGAVLDAWSFPRSEISYVSKTVLRRTEKVVTGLTFNTKVFFTTGSGIDYAFDPGEFRLRRKLVDRTLVATLPLPAVHLKLPGTSSLKWLNIAALANGRTRVARR